MKHGINPVVATVLLIAVAVVAAMGIYFWAAGQDVSAPRQATFVDISVTPVDVDAGKFLVTNMGEEYIELARLDTVSGITCDFPVLTTLAPGESATCTTSAPPFCEMLFWGEGTATAITLMGGNCTAVGTGHVPMITFIGEDTGGLVDPLTDVNFTATVTDADGDLDTVKLFTNITGGMVGYAMAPAGGDNFAVTINATAGGLVQYYAWANDTAGHTNTNGTYWFHVRDNPPVIWNVFDNSSGEIMCGLAVSVNSTITDDIDVDSAWVDDGSTNRSMAGIGGNVWETTFTPGMAGVFRYYVKANDTADQWSTSAMQDFDMVQNFMREYGLNAQLDVAYAIQQIDDGGYIVAGRWGSPANISVAKMTSNGTVVWAKEYGGASEDRVESIKQTTDGGYILAGYTASYGAGSGDAFLIKLDEDGAVSWANAYGKVGTIEQAHEVIEYSGGGYLLVGEAVVAASDFDVFAVKVTSGGVVSWAYRYGEPDNGVPGWNNYERGWGVVETPGGDFMIAGEADSYPYMSNTTPSMFLLRLNWSGGVEWSAIYVDNNDFVSPGGIAKDSNNDYVVCGYMGAASGPGGDDGGIVLKLNDSNLIEWANAYYNSSNRLDFGSGTGSIDVSGTEYVVAGQLGTDVDPAVLGMKVDSSGTLQWANQYGDGDPEGYTYDVEATDDGGMIIAAETGDYADAFYNGWLIKTDRNGDCVNCSEYSDRTSDVSTAALTTSWNMTFIANSTDVTGVTTTTAIALPTADIGMGQWPICWHGSCAPPHPTWSVMLTPSSMEDAGWDIAEGSMVIAGEKVIDNTPPIDTEMIVYKLDDDGNEVWSSTFDKDIYADSARAITKTSDGGYLVTGYAKVNFGFDTKVWTIKLNSTGGKEWESLFYSGWDNNVGWGSVEAADGYVVGGHVFNAGGDADVLILKLNKTDGTQMWNETHHFAGHDYCYSIILDGTDFIIGGMSNDKFLVMKANSAGGHVWNSTFDGGAGTDHGFDITHANGGGYVITGRTNFDVWAIKVDTSGNEVWNTTFDSGAGTDIGAAITNVSDGYVIVGTAAADVLVLKLDLGGNYMWDQIYDGGGSDEGQGVAQTSDGGLAVGGTRRRSGSNYALWALKLNSWGEFW
ncbi:MAG: hypothetical protein KAW41_03570 [Candidatus Diapherotrites archaeon]|nr:hypothetical protein [Candidatus Diapherotrites archaeon]